MYPRKIITCTDCGSKATVPVYVNDYGFCDACGAGTFECSAAGGCPECLRGMPVSDDHFAQLEAAYDQMLSEMRDGVLTHR